MLAVRARWCPLLAAWRRGVVLAVTGLLAATSLLVACTSDEDEPTASATAEREVAGDDGREQREDPKRSAGLRVAVLLPDDGAADRAILNDMAADVRRLGATRPSAVAEIRPHRPGEAAVVADLAWTLADRGTDLICVLGRSTRSLVTELAQLYPDRRFCVAPLSANAEVPEPVQVLDIRSEELGHVVGAAAASLADRDDVIGVVLGTEATPRGSFRDGLLAATGGWEVVQTAVDEEHDVIGAVEHVLAEGADVVVLDSVEGASAAVDVAADEAVVLAPEGIVGGAAVERTAVTWQVHWDVILRAAIERLVDEEATVPGSFGFAEGTFTVTPGRAATTTTSAVLERLSASFAERERDPLQPSDDVVPRPPPPEPDEADDSEEADEADPADDDG